MASVAPTQLQRIVLATIRNGSEQAQLLSNITLFSRQAEARFGQRQLITPYLTGLVLTNCDF